MVGTSNLRQDATIWVSTPNGFGGYSFGAPTVIKCRWEDKQELIPGSATELSRAIVYVSQDVGVDDYILLGISASSDPVSLGAQQVINFQKMPDLRNLSTLKKVWL